MSLRERYDPLTLAFRDAGLERSYRGEAAARDIGHLRLGIVASIATWARSSVPASTLISPSLLEISLAPVMVA